MNFKAWTICAVLLPIAVTDIAAEKILFFITIGSRSHRFAMQPLAAKLVDHGHDVTFLAAVKPEVIDPRIHEINLKQPFVDVLEQLDQLAADSVAERLKGRHHNHLLQGTVWYDVLIRSSEAFLSNIDFVKLINTTERYDLVVGDFTCKELSAAMAYKMNAKVIWFNTCGALYPYEGEMMGLPFESNWLPELNLGSPYWFIPDHVFTTFNSIWWYWSYHWYCLHNLDILMQRYLGNDIPPLHILQQNIDLVLLNELFTYTYARSLNPLVVPIGGMHVTYTDGTLPKQIQNFIDPFEHFVLISFGSIIDENRLPPKLRQNMFDAVASFENVRFLWKWDGEVPNNLPSNVITMKWFPQQEILASSKCKGFVTQGGAMSFQQAIYHAVPMIVVPVWSDQPAIARSVVHHGVGIHLELSEITQESFRFALHEIIFNEKYKNIAKNVSQLAKDQPMTSVDTAAWWVEFVLRHNVTHFKSPAAKQTWWQRRLLDVWFIGYTILLITVVTIYKIVDVIICSIGKYLDKRNRFNVKKRL